MVKVLYIVAPCFNEEEVLPVTAERFTKKLLELIKTKKISPKSRIVFVDDGSTDKTWEIIKGLNKKDKMLGGVKLSRNCGHQSALLAGLMSVKDKADIVVSIDADLQDDIDAIDSMIAENERGAEIVYGVRDSRKTDSFFKRSTAQLFYKLMNKLGVKSVYNHADYRLMTRRVLYELENFREVNLFLRGVVTLLGFKTAVVKYDRYERFAGESKYPLKKMLQFAVDGITSFSAKPLTVAVILGILIILLSMAVLIYTLIVWALGYTVEGWTFISLSVWFIGGAQIFFLGIMGGYIGKIYSEIKARPRFIIEEEL